MNLWENIKAEALQQISVEQAWHYSILPFSIEEGKLCILCPDSCKLNDLQEELEMLLGKKVALQPADISEIQKAIGKHYRQSKSNEQGGAFKLKGEANSFLEKIIVEAQQLGASDIHLEPFEHSARMRIRIDGALIEKYKIEKPDYAGIVNQIKIQANLDIAEKRLPQDGRIFHEDSDNRLDIRVSSLPTLHGEKIVMRLLMKDAKSLDIEALGFDQKALKSYFESVRMSNGIVLISGPTGSGKTTTLYATLKILNETKRNVITIEDPIEYTLEGINQVQLREGIGLDYPSAMRTFLRQDPDVIMVGEIRDLDTAEMAIRASLTGHLVLSTIHTNSAWGIIARLLDMGTPAYLLADTLNAAVAQRLIRLLCPICKKESTLDDLEFPERFEVPYMPKSHYTAEGCTTCYYSGYQGRKAVYEVIKLDRELQQCIREQRLDIQDVLMSKGVQSLANSAFSLFAKGQTSLAEILPLLN